MPIQIENLSHTYQAGSPFQSVALHDVTFNIEDGELLALIGHTGSGKSTLAQHLNGLLKPTSGRVLLDGQDINDKAADRRALRHQVGLVFQYPEHQLFEETVARDVAFGPKNLGLSADEQDARVREALSRVGLSYDEIAPKSPFELSGGQMRRVAMAGVLAMRPRILVLDEPAAGLDPHGRERILNIIKDLHASGTTVVMISHSMDDVAQLATRIVVMARGTVVMQGAPGEVFSRAEELQALGLDVPQTCKLSQRLRQMGVPMPTCYLAQDALEALLALFGKEAPHA